MYFIIPTWLLAQNNFMVALINKAEKLSVELKGKNKPQPTKGDGNIKDNDRVKRKWTSADKMSFHN